MRNFLCVFMFVTLAFMGPASAKVWKIDYSKSHVTVTVKQAIPDPKSDDAAQEKTDKKIPKIKEWSLLEGEFKSFSANINFDPSYPAKSQIVSNIDVLSLGSDHEQLTALFPNAEWLDAKAFPKADFVSTKIEYGTAGTCFNVTGIATIKRTSKKVSFPFCLVTEGVYVHAKGTINLLRSDFLVGTGQWGSQDVYANDITINIDLLAN